MKLSELLQEQEKLNEALPVAGFAIAGIAFTKILTAVGAFLTAMTMVDLYRFIDNYSEDPEQVTEDQWFDFFLDIMLLAFPGIAKYGKPYFAKLIPTSIKKRAAAHVKAIAIERYRKDIKAANSKYGVSARTKAKSTAERNAMRAAHAKAKQAAKTRADSTMSALSGNAIFKVGLKAAGAGVMTSLARSYWTRMSELEEDWRLYQEGSRETETFGDMDQSEAERHAYDTKKKIAGELAVSVGTMVASWSIGKKLEVFGNFFGRIAGGGLVGGLFSVPANIGSAIVRVGGPGIAAFLQTDTGRKLLENQFVETIVKVTGGVASTAWDTLKSIADYAGKAVGVDLGLGKTPAISRPQFKEQDPWGIKIKVDPTNPKLKFIGDVEVTDPKTGYLLASIPNRIQDIRRRARAAGQPDPTQSIARDPNEKYLDLPV